MSITITPDGDLRFIWLDALSDLVNAGTPRISRASSVEPTPEGKWAVDLAPVGGPILQPFTKRSEALAAEVRWLEQKGY